MGTFGWSYPPGCSSAPYDEDYPCELCGLFENDCICPECPECKAVGDPDCYKEHSMTIQQSQKNSLTKQEELWSEQSKIENEAYNQEIEI